MLPMPRRCRIDWLRRDALLLVWLWVALLLECLGCAGPALAAPMQTTAADVPLPLPVDVGFVVGVLPDPVANDFVPASVRDGLAEGYIMTGSDGKRYYCSIPIATPPEVDDDDEEEESRDGAARQQTVSTGEGAGGGGKGGKGSDDGTGSSSTTSGSSSSGQSGGGGGGGTVDLSAVLSSKLRGKCLIKSHGWWKYSVCPFNKITQFHSENGKRTTEFLLGTFALDSNGVGAAGDPLYTQTYSGGDQGRHVEVRYKCRASLTSGTVDVGDVREPSMHKYELDLFLAAACRPGDVSVEPTAGPSAAPTPAATAAAAPTAKQLRKMSPAGLLEPLGENCLFHNTGWWTYEVCYGKHVRQFHIEQVPHGDPLPPEKAGGPPRQPVKAVEAASFTLGLFPTTGVPAATSTGPGAERLAYMNKFTDINKRLTVEDTFASQWYGEGTKCDLTGKPRRTLLQFYCSRKSTGAGGQGHHIVHIKETSTCEYAVRINTPLLCVHKLFAPKTAPVRSIACRPMKE